MIYEVITKSDDNLGSVDTVMIDGEIWYSVSDIAKLTDIQDWFMVCLMNIPLDEKKNVSFAAHDGCIRHMSVVQEKGFDTLVSYSSSSKIKTLREWLFPKQTVNTAFVKLFDNEEFGSVRVITINDEPWFIGKDVATALGYKNTNDALSKHVDDDDKIMGSKNTTPSIVDAIGRIQYPTWINESGVYALIFGSKLESAQRFKHWVTSEVLPSIRKHGAYMTTQTLEQALTSPDFLIQLANKLKNEQETNRMLQAENERMKPKEKFYDAVSNTKEVISVAKMAGILCQEKGFTIGQNRLFEYLRKKGYLCSAAHVWNKPSQVMIDKGYFLYKENYNRGDVTFTPLITGSGQIFLTKIILKDLADSM